MEGSLQAMPPGQREGLWGRSEGTAVQAGSEQNPVKGGVLRRQLEWRTHLAGSELILGGWPFWPSLADSQQLAGLAGLAGWEVNGYQGSNSF